MPAGNPDPADARCEPGPRRCPLRTRTPPMAPRNPDPADGPWESRRPPMSAATSSAAPPEGATSPGGPPAAAAISTAADAEAAGVCARLATAHREGGGEMWQSAARERPRPRSAQRPRHSRSPPRCDHRFATGSTNEPARRRRPRPGRPGVGPQLRVRSGIAPARDVSCETSSRPLNSRHLTSRPEPRPHPARDRRALPPPVSSATAANANSLAPRRMTKAAAAVGTPLHPPPAFHVKRNGVDPRVLCAAPRFNFPRALSAGKLMGVGRERRCHGGIRVCGASSARRNRAQSAHDEASCSIRHSGLRHGVGVRPVARGLKFSG